MCPTVALDTMHREIHMKRKIVFVLIDGIGDVSIPSIGCETPVERGQTPVLDSISSKLRPSDSTLISISVGNGIMVMALLSGIGHFLIILIFAFSFDM